MASPANMDKSNSSTALGVLVDKVTFVNKLPLLNSATSDDDRPVTGAMYQELCNVTFSSGSNCQQVLDFLLSRLDDQSCYVKLKVLKILKYLVERGHPQFRQSLRRTSQGVTDTTKFSRPVSGVHSDFSGMVRTEAKELCELMFNVADNDSEIPRQPAVQQTVTGGMGSSGTSSKMQGFGNMAQPKRSMIDRLTNGLQGFADTIMNPSSWKQTTNVSVLPQENQFGAFVPIKLDPKVLVDHEQDMLDLEQPVKRAAPALTPSNAHHLTRGHKRGVAGGGWEEPEETCDSHMTRSCDTSDSSSTNQTSRLEAEESEDREAELVVDTLKSAASDLLTRAELRTFTAKCTTLNCDAVVKQLNQLLATSDTADVLRSLCLLECLLRTDLVSIDQVALTCLTSLSHLSTSQHPASILMKARKVH
ncbi:AP-4 complex accessory subunit tepsin [Lamellibrachia satsuma]|nr:AP-4 complex accessory subunit tepsin [Lamellibrachia satsuma]